ncbi:MAG TPA: tetratricopeptide repeat protein [Bacteroidales bacterium]|nr:tetratricopeptide repeat protein [Bacteroidales bacterium]HPI85837.1 tetratricopeptide repeat protein [Bacteroidales bacterium]HPM92336.1 tetratricopeptide repeat protein [Bacteroidales bacterium]
MRIIKVSFLILLLAIIWQGCTSDPKTRIRDLEKKIGSESFILDDKGMALSGELIRSYLDFAESHKDDPSSPEFLYKAADLSLNTGQSKQSLDLYNRIIYQYPNFEKVPECLFLVGYIYENYFQELGKAKSVYEAFLAKYPEHDFADDARVSIENLGKSPEELIRYFEEKNKALSDTLTSMK